AEDGIRDDLVTGVQTCALPIWTRMMRSTGARFRVCARVLMTSLAANNILPLRIGDIMRVFTYAGNLGAAPSVILSTVILEKLLRSEERRVGKWCGYGVMV